MSNLSDKPVPGLPPVLCRQCGTMLNPVLVTAGYATHPCCDPAEKPWEWRDVQPSGRRVVPLPLIRREVTGKPLSPRQRAARDLARQRSREAIEQAERMPPPPEAPSLPKGSREVTTVTPPEGLF